MAGNHQHEPVRVIDLSHDSMEHWPKAGAYWTQSDEGLAQTFEFQPIERKTCTMKAVGGMAERPLARYRSRGQRWTPPTTRSTRSDSSARSRS